LTTRWIEFVHGRRCLAKARLGQYGVGALGDEESVDLRKLAALKHKPTNHGFDSVAIGPARTELIETFRGQIDSVARRLSHAFARSVTHGKDAIVAEPVGV
jgi:hypothetical protein